MPYVQAQGARIHYLTLPDVPRCPAGAPCLTLVHGGGGSAYAFFRQMPYFASRGFYVITMSTRGWGASVLDRDDPELYASHFLAPDVIAVLDAVGAHTTALLGHSVGGFTVTRMAQEAPERLSAAIMSNTFYGLVDTPHKYLERYVSQRQTDQLAVERLAAEIKEALPADCAASRHPSRGPEEGRFVHPRKPNNFSPAFREAQPELAWLYDALNDGNEQCARLHLKKRFKVLQAEGAVTPAAMRAAWGGPLLLTTTECDSLVHWECVALAATQLAALDSAGSTTLHWFTGSLYHAPNIEDPEQYNRVVLNFLRRRPLDAPDEPPLPAPGLGDKWRADSEDPGAALKKQKVR